MFQSASAEKNGDAFKAAVSHVFDAKLLVKSSCQEPVMLYERLC